MIGKIIKLDNGLEYYVVDEIFKDKSIYLFMIQTSLADDIISDKCLVAEAKIVDGNIVIDNIYDEAEQEKINDIVVEHANKGKIGN